MQHGVIDVTLDIPVRLQPHEWNDAMKVAQFERKRPSKMFRELFLEGLETHLPQKPKPKEK